MPDETPSYRADERRAAFLLVIPGCVGIGAGIGLLFSKVAAGLLVGAGSGFLLWGLIIALRRNGPRK